MFAKGRSAKSPRKQTVYQEGVLLKVLAGSYFLDGPSQQLLVRQLRQLVNISERHFESLYIASLTRFAEYTQTIPSQTGGPLSGLFNEGLARAVSVTKQAILSEQYPKDSLYHYALFTAALLSDVAKLVIHQRTLVTDHEGKVLGDWRPLNGSLVSLGAQYYKMYQIAPIYQRLVSSITPMLAQTILPKIGFEWIVSDFKVFSAWLDALSGDFKQTGVIAHELSLMPQEEWLALLAELGQVPVELKESSHEAGEAFFQWLKQGLEDGSLKINAAESGIFMTEDGLFLERNKVFRQFAEHTGQSADMVTAYQEFAKLFGANDVAPAQYFDAQVRRGESLATPFGNRSLLTGMAVSDSAMLIMNARVPAVSSLLKALQSTDKTSERSLPTLKSPANPAQPLSPKPVR